MNAFKLAASMLSSSCSACVATANTQLEKEVRWYQGYTSGSWRVDGSKQANSTLRYRMHASFDKQGRTIDFLLTHRRNAKPARRFLAKALRTRQKSRTTEQPCGTLSLCR